MGPAPSFLAASGWRPEVSTMRQAVGDTFQLLLTALWPEAPARGFGGWGWDVFIQRTDILC